MTKQDVLFLITRDLNKLKAEIEAFSNEENLWKIADGVSNSAGNLALHLLGNLNTYIGAELGETGYLRNRDAEFADKNIPKSQLLSQIDELIPIIKNTVIKLTDTQLSEDYPLEVLNRKTSTGLFLIHLHGHLNYHLGQVNYLRRLIDR